MLDREPTTIPGRRRRCCAIILRTLRSTRRPTLRRSNNGQGRVATIPFSTEALQATLLRLQNEWEYAIFQYLTAVFEMVMVWAKEVGPSSALVGPAPARAQFG